MVIKKIKDRKKRQAAGTAAYIADAKRAAQGQTFGPKVEFSGTVNCLSENWREATEEIKALAGSYKAEGNTTAHWTISLQEGDRFTAETARDAVQTFLKHQGMSDHLCMYAAHNDKKNHHIHVMVCRVAPEPDPAGEYKISWKGATIQAEKGNNEIESAHVCLAELCHRHGWKAEEKARYIWKDGAHVRVSHADPALVDQVKMGQRVEAWEARAGVKHPKRILAETALATIRAAGSDKSAAVAALAAQGILYSDVDYLDNKGRRHQGGKLTGIGGEEVKISALPKDCRWIAKQPAQAQPPVDIMKGTKIYQKIVTFGAAKKYIKQAVAEAQSGTELFQKFEEKGLIFEQTGKAGGRIRFGKQPADVIKLSECGTSFSQLQTKFADFPPYASNVHGSQGKVNGDFRKDAMTGGKDASNNHQSSIETLARGIFKEAKTTAEMQKAFENQGIAFTREVATDKKTGRQFEFGKLARDGETITLKSLGVREDGKALFTLAGIDRVFLARDAAAVVSTASSWKEAETMLANDKISYSRVKTTTAQGGEVIVGRLERNGITSSLGLAGKDFQPGALDARLMPYSTAKALYEQARTQQNPVHFLSKQGLTASDIDRIGRVGEKLEPNLKKGDKPAQAPASQAPAPRPEKSIIPRNINEILDMIEESAQQAAALAAANANAGRAAWEARAAENRAQAAEKALADLKASIQHEQPARPAAAKEKPMSETTTHAPTPAAVPAGGNMEMEREKERIQSSEKMTLEKEREREKEKQRMQREREKARQRQ